MTRLLRIFLMACMVCVCIAAIIYIHIQVRQLRASIAERIQYIEHIPAAQQQLKLLQNELASARIQKENIAHLLVSKEDLSNVVANISRSAVQSGVSVQIPEVDGESTSSAVLYDVRVRMNAVGSPSSLIAFLYRLEHLPYVIHIASWNLDTTYQSAVQSFVGSVPPGAKAPVAATGSRLSVEAVISLTTP